MIVDDVAAFLKKTPPFQFLDDESIKWTARGLSLEFYPRDKVILKQDGPPSDTVRIIKKGGVKILLRSENGEDVVVDYRGEGESFGFVSMIGKDRQKTTVVAAEDTICYILGKDRILKLVETHPEITEYFMSYLARYVSKTYDRSRPADQSYGSADRIMLATPASQVAKPVVKMSESETIRDAARLMADKKISSLVIMDERGAPSGIITDRDLREKVVAAAKSVYEPVKSIMTPALIRVDSGDSCFTALLKMIRHNIHHILVSGEGGVWGILTNHDIMLLQGNSPLSFAADIEKQTTVEGLRQVAERTNGLTGLLVKDGAAPAGIMNIATEINDRLVGKMIALAEEKLGPPPLQWCWVSFGSEGRKEQVFRLDQDNALLWADSETNAEEEAAASYFEKFASFINDGLVRIGFPACTAGYMAANPQWRGPIKFWKKYFLGWISEPSTETAMKSMIFFDMRPVSGNPLLADELTDYFLSLIHRYPAFLGHMANFTTRTSPPIGFLKSFVVEKSGEHKNQFDLKLKGITPLTDIIRLFALEKGVAATSTYERISALRESGSILEDYAEEALHAFDFMSGLLLKKQAEGSVAGEFPDTFINPEELDGFGKKTMREAFHLISRLQGMIVELYKTSII